MSPKDVKRKGTTKAYRLKGLVRSSLKAVRCKKHLMKAGEHNVRNIVIRKNISLHVNKVIFNYFLIVFVKIIFIFTLECFCFKNIFRKVLQLGDCFSSNL